MLVAHSPHTSSEWTPAWSRAMVSTPSCPLCRASKRSRRSSSAAALRVEQLECRLQPAAWDQTAAVLLQSGGSVAPLSIVQYPLPIDPVSASGSGTHTSSGVDAYGVPHTNQTT